jgi:hypothetical protein
MDDTPTNENPAKDFNKLDLTQLQSFSFGTQWTQDKPDPSGRPASREGRRDDRPRRDGPGGGAGPAGEFKRDRRSFRKPAGAPGSGPESAPTGEYPGGGGAPRPQGEFRGPRNDFRGGPRREGPGGGAGYRNEGGYRGEGGGYRDGGDRGPVEPRGPYISPFFLVTFYPEDVSFAALAKTIRASCRTFELFDIAKTVIGKNDRFVVVVQRKPSEGAAAAEKPVVFSIAVPDGLPFETDDAAIGHVMAHHLAHFFDGTEAEVEAPKGNYLVINKCSITGELLGPPNYHRYNQIVQQHHAAKVARMSLEAYRGRIESVRDPEVVNQWLEKMKKVTRYVWKRGEEGSVPLTFDNLEDARMYLLTNARDQVVRNVDSVRFPGKQLESLPPGEIQLGIVGALERQRRFPLDTANALRGRLRREGFTIFKKGSKGISYVCAVKRKFRVPAQTFADSIGGLISFVETHPMVRASELPEKMLGLKLPAPAKPVAEGAEPAPAPTPLTAEEQQALSRLQGDLRWLVTEGYVTEFMDGRLFAPPAMVEARKKEVEASEHDPENFPEVPADPAPAVVAPAPKPALAPAPAPAPAAVAVAPAEEPAAEVRPETPAS